MKIDIDHNRGDTFDYSFMQTNTNDTTNVWFTIKDQKCENDDDAIIQVDEMNGLLIVNGQPALDSTKASIIRVGRVIRVIIDAIITSQIPSRYPLFFDVQLLQGDDIRTPFNGRWSNVSDVTRTIEPSANVDAVLWPDGGVVLWPDGQVILWP